MAKDIIVYYGTGKGKTSAALGAAVRNAADGGNAIVIQFLKETKTVADFYSKLEPELRIFRFDRTEEKFENISDEQKQEEIENIRNGWQFAKKVASTGECEVLVLDECLALIDLGIISMDEVKAIIDSLSYDGQLIFTGTELPSGLSELATEVYNLSTVKKMEE